MVVIAAFPPIRAGSNSKRRAASRALRSNTGLTSLQLRDCELDDVAIRALAAALPANRALRQLGVECNVGSVDASKKLATSLRAGAGVEQISLGNFCGNLKPEGPPPLPGREPRVARRPAKEGRARARRGPRAGGRLTFKAYFG